MNERIADLKARDNALVIWNLAAAVPGADTDAWLVKNRPARIAEGVKAVADACGAEILVYAPAGMDTSGLTPLLPGAVWKTGEASPVLREETALYALLTDGIIRSDPEEHALYRAFPSEGLDGRPTLVLSAEEALWGLDRPAEKLVLIDGEAVFVKLGDPLPIDGEGYVLVGGCLGSYCTADEARRLAVTFDRVFDGVTRIPETACMADEIAGRTRQNAAFSCGKCVLCREGSFHLNNIFENITAGKAKREELPLIEDISPLITAGALCAFGKHMTAPALSGYRLCREEIDAHVTRKTCPKNVCQAFVSYAIDPQKCTGCGDCLDACEYDAIEGKRGFIHMIDPKMCEKCGKCVDACEEGAIALNTTGMRTPKKLTKVGLFR